MRDDVPRGLNFEVVDYMDMFNRLSQPPLILNDVDVSDKEKREDLKSLILTRYEGDTLVNVPTCVGGHLRSERYLGVMCEICNSKVDYVTERPLESLVWFRVPEPVPQFFNLTVWMILKRELTVSGFSILDWLTTLDYLPKVQVPPIVAKLEEAGMQRGLTNFINHYDEYIDLLVELKVMAPRKGRRRRNGQSVPPGMNHTVQFLKQYRDRTFTQYLPFPSSLVFILEESGGRSWADLRMTPAIESLWTIAGINARHRPPTLRQVEQACVVAMNRLTEFYVAYESDLILGKPGIYRKLVYGVRPPWTFRAVITSQFGPHQYDELIFPWSLSVSLFRLHIANRLLARGYTPQEALALISENTLKYHSLIRKIFDEILYEGDGPVYTTWQRFPSLRRLSNERMKIGGIKDDVTDNTIDVSVMTLRGKNAKLIGLYMGNCIVNSL